MQVDANLIRFLSGPDNYAEAMGPITHRETHISHVFVGRDLAYKIKKPVDLGFLDFTTLPRRRYFCRQEVLLNSRLAPGYYLDVVRVYGKNGHYSFKKARGWSVAEYAVKMKCFPEEKLVASLVGQGRRLSEYMETIGHVLAQFHGRAKVSRTDTCGTIQMIRTNTEENFRQIEPSAGSIFDLSFQEQLVRYTRDFIAERRQLFVERKKGGFVREGHGDLQSRHVCLIDPPIIVDCIEFNERLRTIDVLEDIAFLLMDLEYAGRFDLSAACCRAYFSNMSGPVLPDLLKFYKVYRAVVRLKIEAITAGSIDDRAAKESSLRRARDYALLAQYYIRCDGLPFNPIVMMGLSGSGKSRLTQGLLDNVVVLKSDELRKELAGLQAGQHAYVEWQDSIYSREMTDRTYTYMADCAVTALQEGRRVVVDATFLFASQRKEFYNRCLGVGANPLFVYCTAVPDVLRTRIAGRLTAATDVSDAHLKVLEQQLLVMEDPDELPCFRVLKIDTDEAVLHIQHDLRSFL